MFKNIALTKMLLMMQGQWPPGKRLPGWMASPVLVTVFQAPKLQRMQS